MSNEIVKSISFCINRINALENDRDNLHRLMEKWINMLSEDGCSNKYAVELVRNSMVEIWRKKDRENYEKKQRLNQ